MSRPPEPEPDTPEPIPPIEHPPEPVEEPKQPPPMRALSLARRRIVVLHAARQAASGDDAKTGPLSTAAPFPVFVPLSRAQ